MRPVRGRPSDASCSRTSATREDGTRITDPSSFSRWSIPSSLSLATAAPASSAASPVNRGLKSRSSFQWTSWYRPPATPRTTVSIVIRCRQENLRKSSANEFIDVAHALACSSGIRAAVSNMPARMPALHAEACATSVSDSHLHPHHFLIRRDYFVAYLREQLERYVGLLRLKTYLVQFLAFSGPEPV